jgi:AcrR family transcriptional regulator
MVNITHSGENLLKINLILKAAQKRFGLYGLEKTTMKEIAADVGISKAALYYYFPDKEHIFKMVVEDEQEMFFDLIRKKMLEMTDPADMLREFVSIRLNYFKRFFNLSRLRLEEFRHMKPILEDTLIKLRNRENEVVELILQKGVDSRVFHLENPTETAILFLETQRAIRGLVFHNKALMYIEQEEFDILFHKIEAITEIFIRGLRYVNP